jgi:hypothetical protein
MREVKAALDKLMLRIGISAPESHQSGVAKVQVLNNNITALENELQKLRAVFKSLE